MNYCIIQTTYDKKKIASKVATMLLAKKLAACIQLNKIKSFYTYENKLHKDSEYILSIKTKKSKYDEIQSFIKATHPYNLPEIICIDITNASEEYLQWIEENVE
ncbi:divalent-cation tolerance protein CutA [Arcobacter sp. FWKO B]|uniref:divalent-cation tolerance protein CutA n=1 Tax=Arcobacter sp. FWKO B TaxID=2593672 RepID=UPI0018A4C7BC|nr:divalent-cation tolerance protein CutA [Arcobacter sp. FWKO B]QOG12121.1 divalent-cation tolerance protein CutA [Arcobacter sp. FWKO B]